MHLIEAVLAKHISAAKAASASMCTHTHAHTQRELVADVCSVRWHMLNVPQFEGELYMVVRGRASSAALV